MPRVFEKVYNSAEQTAAAGGKLKIFRWAAETAIAWSRAKDSAAGPSAWVSVQHTIADKLVYSKLRAKLGGRVRYAVSQAGGRSGNAWATSTGASASPSWRVTD